MSRHSLTVPRSLRDAVLRRASGACELCGAAATAERPLEVDHITPVARGGRNALGALRAAHGACNRLAWTKYAAWERARDAGDAQGAPWFRLETPWYDATLCCDPEGVIRAAHIPCGRPAAAAMVGRTLRDVVAELECKGQLVRCTPLAEPPTKSDEARSA